MNISENDKEKTRNGLFENCSTRRCDENCIDVLKCCETALASFYGCGGK